MSGKSFGRPSPHAPPIEECLGETATTELRARAAAAVCYLRCAKATHTLAIDRDASTKRLALDEMERLVWCAYDCLTDGDRDYMDQARAALARAEGTPK